MHGNGAFTWPDGRSYYGEFSNGLKHGQGKFTSKNGIVYDGAWQEGKQNGKGKVLDYAGNVTQEGSWVKGSKVY